MESSSPSLLQFGVFTLDLALCELRKEGSRIPVEPKALDLLIYLVAHRDRLVSSRELFDTIWQGTTVGPSALRRTMLLLRRALEDDVRNPRWLSTVSRRGYRFIGEITGKRAGALVQVDLPLAPRSDYRKLFVGRGLERALWNGALDRAVQGEGSLLLIEGEAGMGKTRFMEWCVDQARLSGVRPIASACWEDEGAPPLWPWMEAIRQISLNSSASERVQRALDDAAPTLAGLFPSLGALLRGGEVARATDSRALRFQAYEAMRELLHEISQETPLVLLFDDLHRADSSSLALLEFLSNQLAGARIVFAGTMRPEGSERAELVRIARATRCQTVPLLGLEAADILALLKVAVPRYASDEAVAARIWQQTGGNAFFVHQILPLAALLEPGESIARLLPRTVRKAIERQCAGLSADVQTVMRSASVFGRTFSVLLLAQALDRTLVSTMEAVDEAVREHLLLENPEHAHHYRFVHVLVRDVLYEELGSHERAQLHGRIGRTLEAEVADPEQIAAELAHHFNLELTPNGMRKAAWYHAQAGQISARRFDHEAAIAHYRSALHLLESQRDADPRDRCDLRLHLAGELFQLGRIENAGEEWLRAVDDARLSGDRVRMARVAVDLSSGFYTFPYPVSPRMAGAILAEAAHGSEMVDTTERARVFARLTYIHAISEDGEAVERTLFQAVRLAKESGDPSAMAEALACEHMRRRGTPAVRERADIASELIRCAKQASNYALEIGYLGYLSADLIELGKFDEWEGVIAAHRELANRLKSPHYLAISTRNSAMRALVRGEFSEARSMAEHALTLVQHCDPHVARELFGTFAAVEYETVGITPQLLERISHISDPVLVGMTELWAFQQMGRKDEVLLRLGPGVAYLRSGSRGTNWQSIACSLAQAVAFVGNKEVAEEALIWFDGFEEFHISAGAGGMYFGPVRRYTGLLQGTLGRREAMESLELALEQVDAIPSPPWVARINLDLAEICSRRGSRARAIAYASEALRIGLSLRMPLIERRAREIAGG